MESLQVSSLVPMYYESFGSGIPVVFIHPPHMDHVVFRYQRELARYFRVILYDIRGHGRSGIDAEPVTVPILADDLRLLLDKLGIDQAVVCGYSSGGSVAQEFALTYPDRLKALILSGGFPRVSSFLLKNEFRAGMALVKSGRQRFLCNVLSFSHYMTKEDRHDLFQHCLEADERMAYQFYRDSYHYDCVDRLSELSSPLLLLNGTKAFYMHSYIPIYWRYVKRVTSVMIADSSHQLPMRSYFPFNHSIRKFVSSLE